MELNFMHKVSKILFTGLVVILSANLLFGNLTFVESPRITAIEIINAPLDITVTCDKYNPEPKDPGFIDDCLGDISISFSESSTRGNTVSDCSFYEYVVTRQYTATNACNDSLVFVYTINVIDTTGPDFSVPDDVTVSCLEVDNLDLTGRVVSNNDLCGSPSTAIYFDGEVGISCNTTFQRIWQVSDACGNTTEKIQHITIFDSIPPKFVSAPRDINVFCFLTDNPYPFFNDWLANFGNATWSDCDLVTERFVAVPGSYDINDPTTFPGEHPGALNDPDCGTKKFAIQFEEVDFVLIDACGNASFARASFNFIDEIPPQIQNCAANLNIVLNPTACDTSLTFQIPMATDECLVGDINIVITNEQVLFSSEPGSTETPVNDLNFKLGKFGPEITFEDSNYFSVIMSNLDGDQEGEYFTIFDEDGNERSTTPIISAQCGDTSFIIGPFLKDEMIAWAADNYIDFKLVNHTDSTDNSLSVNDICLNSRIRITQTYSIKRSVGAPNIFFKINQNDPILVSGLSVSSKFKTGVNTVEFIAVDCAGNKNKCEQKITVRDTKSPLTSCSSNLILETSLDSCNASKLIKDLVTIQDLCQEPNKIKIQLTGATSALFDSVYDTISNNNVYFNSGLTNVFISASDFSNNTSGCSLQVQVNDIQDPVAVCTQKDIEVLAVELESISITPEVVGLNSYDNCEIRSMFLQNNSYNCSDLNTTVGRNLVVVDMAGNISTCVANFLLKESAIPLTYQAGLCPNDPLRLITNVKDESYYEYIWSGPLGFFSGEAEPVIPSVLPLHEGTYNVTISNKNTGCESYASIFVDIEDVKTPVLSTDTIGCESVPHRLETTSIFGATSYNWYELIGELYYPLEFTDGPLAEVFLTPGNHDIVVTASNNDCESEISNLISVEVRDKPIAAICETIVKGCLGDPLILCVKNPQPGWIINWKGPEGFVSNLPSPVVTESFTSSNSGIYKLIIENNQCISDTMTTAVTTNLKPAQPSIIGNIKYCEGDTLVLASSHINNQNIYVWQSPAGIIRTNIPVLKIPKATNSYTGEWRLSIERGPCISNMSEKVDVVVEPNLFFGITSVPTQCIGAQIQLQTSIIPESMYKWTGPNGFTSIAVSPFITAMPGIYKVEIESPNGCLYGDQITLKTVVKPEVKNIAANVNDECLPAGSTVLLSSSLNSDENIMFDWSGPNNLKSTSKILELPNFINANNGTYTLQVSNGACSSDPFDKEFLYQISPVKPVIDGNSIACIGDSLVLISSNYLAGTIYSWNTPNGIVETNINKLVLRDVVKSYEGNYSLKVSQGNCSSPSSDLMPIIINQNILVPNVSLIGDQCVESDIVLFTNLGGEFPIEWEFPNGQRVLADTIRLENTKISDVGNYRARSYFNGCPSFWSENAVVDFSDPRLGVTIPDNSLFSCNNDGAFLELCIEDQSGATNKVYQWFLGERMIGETSDVCFPVVDFSIFAAGVNKLDLKIEQNGCVIPYGSSIFLDIENVRGLGLEAGDDQLFCRGEELFMDADAPISNKLKGFWTFKDNLQFSDINDPFGSVIIEDDLAKTELIWTIEHDVCGIIIRDTVILTQKTKPVGVSDTFFFDDKELNFAPLENDILLPNNSYTITEATEPRWGEVRLRGDAISFKTDPKYVGGPISFQYTVCDTECPTLCGEGDVIIYFNLSSCQGNNVITANNDGINDIFIIPCIDEEDLPENELFIINELGNTVFQQSPYDNSWDGTFNGQYLPTGTYYYIFRKNEKSSIVQGFIAIER